MDLWKLVVPIDSRPSKRGCSIPSKRNGRGKATWSFSFLGLDLRVSFDRSIDRSIVLVLDYYARISSPHAYNLPFQSRFDESRCRCAISRIVHNCETRRHNGRLIQTWHVSTPLNVLSGVMTRVGRAWRLGARIYEEEGEGIWKVGEEYPGISAGETSWKSYQVVNGSIGISRGLRRTRCLTLSAKNI